MEPDIHRHRRDTSRRIHDSHLGATLQPIPHPPAKKPVSWISLSPHFSDERECLASFLALETAEVLSGIKPANLVRLADKKWPCGRNLLELWKKHGPALIAESPLEVAILRESEDSQLLLFYRDETLGRRLAGRSASTFLKKAGYDSPRSISGALAQLKKRFTDEGFPHEIGLFLGYPLKDVAAFIGWKKLPLSCQRLWKVYGHPRRSLDLADSYLACRNAMASRLAACTRATLAMS